MFIIVVIIITDTVSFAWDLQIFTVPVPYTSMGVVEDKQLCEVRASNTNTNTNTHPPDIFTHRPRAHIHSTH